MLVASTLRREPAFRALQAVDMTDEFRAHRQNRASGACRLAANDRVEAVVSDGLDLAPAGGTSTTRI